MVKDLRLVLRWDQVNELSDSTKSLNQLAGNQMMMFETNPAGFDEAQKIKKGAALNHFCAGVDPRSAS